MFSNSVIIELLDLVGNKILDKIPYLILGILFVFSYYELSKKLLNMKYTINKMHFWGILLISFVTSFSIYGGDNFFPSNQWAYYSWSLLGKYLLFTVMIFFAYIGIVEQLNRIEIEQSSLPSKKQITKAYWSSFLILTIIGLIYWATYFPGNASNDTLSIWKMIQYQDFNDYHGILHPVVVSLLLKLWNSMAIVVCVQIIYFSFVMSLWITFFYKKGIPLFLLLGLGFFIALPLNGSLLVTIWKDIPYTISLLWLSYLFMDYVSKGIENLSVKDYILIGVVVMLPYLFRHNGIIVLFLGLVTLVVGAILKKQWKMIVYSLCSSIVLCFLNFIVIFNLFSFTHQYGINFSSLVLFPVSTAYMYNQEGQLPEKLRELVEVVEPNIWKQSRLYSNNAFFHPVFQNSVEFQHLVLYLNENKVETTKYLLMYISKAPWLFFRAKLNYNDILWRSTRKDTLLTHPSYVIPDDPMPKYKKYTTVVSISETLARYTSLIFPLWFSTIVILFFGIYWILEGDSRKSISIIPWLGNSISLLLLGSANDYRYF